jgi:hypothetical protein
MVLRATYFWPGEDAAIFGQPSTPEKRPASSNSRTQPPLGSTVSRNLLQVLVRSRIACVGRPKAKAALRAKTELQTS